MSEEVLADAVEEVAVSEAPQAGLISKHEPKQAQGLISSWCGVSSTTGWLSHRC